MAQNKLKKALAAVLALLMLFALAGCTDRSDRDYQRAAEAMDSGNYEEAKAIYEELGDYEDSAALARECDYQLAIKLYHDGDLAAAIPALEALGDYQDCLQILAEYKDQQIRQALVGTWLGSELDCSGLFMDSLYSSLDLEQEKFAEYFDSSGLSMQYVLTFTEDGTIVESMEQDKFKSFLDQMAEALHTAIIKFMEDDLEAEAVQNSVTAKEVLDYYGAADMEELISKLWGMSLDQFIQSALVEPLTTLSEIKENGTYRVKDGIVTLITGTQSEEGILDLETGKLTLTGVGAPEDQQDLYPIIFEKQ